MRLVGGREKIYPQFSPTFSVNPKCPPPLRFPCMDRLSVRKMSIVHGLGFFESGRPLDDDVGRYKYLFICRSATPQSFFSPLVFGFVSSLSAWVVRDFVCVHCRRVSRYKPRTFTLNLMSLHQSSRFSVQYTQQEFVLHKRVTSRYRPPLRIASETQYSSPF